MKPLIKANPNDAETFGLPTWEILVYSEASLQQATQKLGHYTIKVEPLADKRLLHKYGFYYCDTLLEPHCDVARLRFTQHPEATISKEVNVDQALVICHGAFMHGRFYRDFNLQKSAADLRYDKWLKQLLELRQVYGLYWQGALAGFIGYSGNNLVLHALEGQHRGKGLAKYWWSAVCCELLAEGNNEVRSSISAANLAILNLYASLGFSFKKARDIYHRLVLKREE